MKIKTSVTLSEELLDAISSETGRANRSAFIEEATWRYLRQRQRAFVVVSRQVVIESAYATVICAPVYSTDNDLGSQVSIGPVEGLE